MATNLTSVLDAVSTALGVVKSIANTPGVNLIPYVSTIAGVIDVAQIALGQGKNVAALITNLKNTFDGGVPTPEELATLDAEIAKARAKLHAPLPPKEEDEPE